MDEINNRNMQKISSKEDDIYGPDTSSHFTVPIKFDENNYPIWKKHFEMVVSGRLKLGFLFGEVPQLDVFNYTI